MQDLLLPISPSGTQPRSDSGALIREWLFRFGVNFEKDIAPVLPLWLETFGGIDAALLEKLFSRALKMCKFFPKVAEILEPVQRAEETAAPEAAEQAWEYILEIRRIRWSPDAPGGFYGGAPKLSGRIAQAARAAGVWRDFESLEELHTWAKKRFVESFLAYSEQDKFLLPDGEIKNLLAEFSQAKALPGPRAHFEDLHRRGLQYAEQNKLLSAWGGAAEELPATDAATRKQIESELQAYGERFKAAIEERQAVSMTPTSESQPVEA